MHAEMKHIENCRNCNQKFKTKSYKTVRLSGRSVIIKCAVCDHQDVIIEDAKCGWPFFLKGPWDIGSECKNPPVYVWPYRSFSGVKFKIICSTHFHESKHYITGFPMISEETKEEMERDIAEKRPFFYSFIATWGLLFLLFGPLLFLYYYFTTISVFARYTFFSFVWLCLGGTWWLFIKANPFHVSLPAGTLKRLTRIWTIIFSIICAIQILCFII